MLFFGIFGIYFVKLMDNELFIMVEEIFDFFQFNCQLVEKGMYFFGLCEYCKNLEFMFFEMIEV